LGVEDDDDDDDDDEDPKVRRLYHKPCRKQSAKSSRLGDF
jgi:hypothetical protein